MQHDWRRPESESESQDGFTAEACIDAFDAQLDYVFASLRRLGGQAWEMEDLAHQVFLALLRSWRAFADQRALRLHLFRLAVRVIARQRRHVEVALADAARSSSLFSGNARRRLVAAVRLRSAASTYASLPIARPIRMAAAGGSPPSVVRTDLAAAYSTNV